MDGVHTSGHADETLKRKVCQTVILALESYLYIKMRTRYDSISGISSYFIFDEGDVDIHDIHISVK